MTTGLIGKKLGMTQVFGDDGVVRPVTVLKAGPCVVVQKKSTDKEGYDSVQLGLVDFVNTRRVNKATTGHFKKAGVEPSRVLREFRVAAGKDAKVGDRITADSVFKVRDIVDVIGISKGRGWSGFVRRHHFRGGDASHGSMFHRAPGSIGASSYPSRVWPGQRMAGQMGNARATVRNLEVLQIDADDNLLIVKGAVPGPKGGLVIIRRAKKVSKGS